MHEGDHAAGAPNRRKLDAARGRVGEQLGRELLDAYLASLKAKADVKINQANLEKEVSAQRRSNIATCARGAGDARLGAAAPVTLGSASWTAQLPSLGVARRSFGALSSLDR